MIELIDLFVGEVQCMYTMMKDLALGKRSEMSFSAWICTDIIGMDLVTIKIEFKVNTVHQNFILCCKQITMTLLFYTLISIFFPVLKVQLQSKYFSLLLNIM
jgi:hypothetical protein